MRSDKKYVILLAGMVLLAFLYGMLGKNSFRNCGLNDVATTEDLLALNLYQGGMSGYSPEDTELVEERTYESFVERQDDYVRDMMEAPVIVRVRPTGLLETGRDSLGQQFHVIEVLKGEERIQKNEEYYIWLLGAWSFPEDNFPEDAILSEMSCNIMYPE